MGRPFQVTENLYFGSQSCCHQRGDIAVVHACKDPCFRKASMRTDGSQSSMTKGRELFLNMVDAREAKYFNIGDFWAFLDFVDKHIPHRPVYIHCNEGKSRAPSLALVYMAKRLNMLPAESYQAAAEEFSRMYRYHPNTGIVEFLNDNWGAI